MLEHALLADFKVAITYPMIKVCRKITPKKGLYKDFLMCKSLILRLVLISEKEKKTRLFTYFNFWSLLEHDLLADVNVVSTVPII